MPESSKIDEIPELLHSGSKEIQEKKSDVEQSIDEKGIPGGGLDQYPLSTVVKGITDLGIRGSSAMALLFSHTQRIETDLNDERKERKKISADLETLKENYFQEREKNAILNERISGATKIKALQSIFLTLGGLIGGIGIKNMLIEITGTSVVFVILGLILLITGWFWPNSLKKGGKS